MENSFKILLFCLIAVTTKISGEDLQLPEVQTPFGIVKGFYKTANNGQVFTAYEGIPYALPPTGKYRFEAPRPLVPWKGTWIANQTTKCIQYDHLPDQEFRKVDGEEDCLYLYIYTPKNIDSNAALDVIVHIHGGAFMFGAGHFWGPEYLLEKNLIFINFNYRVGPFGFLSTEDDIVPGNNGLKDQAIALKWIFENVKYFGGNPESITLTGLSAGGASVTYHYMSQWSAGLFNRGIAVSGSALNPWAFAENSLEKAKFLATNVGCDVDSIEQMVKCLKKRPAYQIAKAVEFFMGYMYNPFSPFGPVVEKAGHNPFLSQEPLEVLQQGKVQDLPLIISMTKDEGLYPAAEFTLDPKILTKIDEKWNELAPHILDYNYTVPKDQQETFAQEIREKYLNGETISKETFPKFLQIVSDRLFGATLEETAKLFAKAMKSRVYFYYFNYTAPVSFSQLMPSDGEIHGVSHADDMLYITKYHGIETKFDEFDQMKELMTNLWINFAKTGDVKFGDFEPERLDVNLNGEFNYLDVESPTKLTMKTAKTLTNYDFWINYK